MPLVLETVRAEVRKELAEFERKIRRLLDDNKVETTTKIISELSLLCDQLSEGQPTEGRDTESEDESMQSEDVDAEMAGEDADTGEVDTGAGSD